MWSYRFRLKSFILLSALHIIPDHFVNGAFKAERIGAFLLFYFMLLILDYRINIWRDVS